MYFWIKYSLSIDDIYTLEDSAASFFPIPYDRLRLNSTDLQGSKFLYSFMIDTERFNFNYDSPWGQTYLLNGSFDFNTEVSSSNPYWTYQKYYARYPSDQGESYYNARLAQMNKTFLQECVICTPGQVYF